MMIKYEIPERCEQFNTNFKATWEVFKFSTWKVRIRLITALF